MNHGLYNSGVGTYTPCLMDCTIVSAPHAPRVVQQITHPMHHGLYNRLYTHAPWIVQHDVCSMHHGLYDRLYTLCTMDCTMLCLSHASWVVPPIFIPWPVHCTMVQTVHASHASWVVQHISIPWLMHCTTAQTVHTSHAPWAVQQCASPCIMGCTTDYLPMVHGLYNCSHSTCIPCTIQQYICLITHGLYNNIPIHGQWIVQ